MNASDIKQEIKALRKKIEELKELENAYLLISAHLEIPIDDEISKDGDKEEEQGPKVGAITQKPQSRKKKRGVKANIVRAAIDRCKSLNFSADTIFELLKEEEKAVVSKLDTSFTLSRFKKQGAIHVIKQGAGSVPSIYSKHPSLGVGLKSSPANEAEQKETLEECF